MAWKDLEHFLVDVSANPHLKSELATAALENLMSGYNLTEEEKSLVRKKDVAAIRIYLADQYKAALSVNLT